MWKKQIICLPLYKLLDKYQVHLQKVTTISAMAESLPLQGFLMKLLGPESSQINLPGPSVSSSVKGGL